MMGLCGISLQRSSRKGGMWQQDVKPVLWIQFPLVHDVWCDWERFPAPGTTDHRCWLIWDGRCWQQCRSEWFPSEHISCDALIVFIICDIYFLFWELKLFCVLFLACLSVSLSANMVMWPSEPLRPYGFTTNLLNRTSSPVVQYWCFFVMTICLWVVHMTFFEASIIETKSIWHWSLCTLMRFSETCAAWNMSAVGTLLTLCINEIYSTSAGFEGCLQPLAAMTTWSTAGNQHNCSTFNGCSQSNMKWYH